MIKRAQQLLRVGVLLGHLWQPMALAVDLDYVGAIDKLRMQFAHLDCVPSATIQDLVVTSKRTVDEVRQDLKNGIPCPHHEDTRNGLNAIASKDYPLALRSLITADERDCRDAAFFLGEIFANGWGVPQSIHKALKWYVRAAQFGNSLAMQLVGDYCHLVGPGSCPSATLSERYIESAEQWLSAAYSSGNCRAIEHLCALKYAARSGKDSKERQRLRLEAEPLFRQAASQGSAYAAFLLGKMELEDLPSKEGKSPASAVAWLRNAALGGYREAQFDLAMLYFAGLGVPGPTETALGWLTKAASSGSVLAQAELGRRLYYGDAVERSYANALSWLQRAADAGVASSQYLVGVLHERGLGIAVSNERAITYYRLAEEQGDREAKFRLGLMSYLGKSQKRSLREAGDRLLEVSYFGKGDLHLLSGALAFCIDLERRSKKEADKVLRGRMESLKRRVADDPWSMQLIDFLLGDASESRVEEIARGSGGADQRSTKLSQVYFYGGVKQLALGDATGAQSRLKKCLALGLKERLETEVAEQVLSQLFVGR